MAQNYEYHTKQKAVLLIFKTKRPNTQMGYVILRSKLQPVPLHFFYKIFISNRKKKIEQWQEFTIYIGENITIRTK